MAGSSHSISSSPFSSRAEDPSLPSLSTYLLSLMSIKRSNLCVSADVHTTHGLLAVAEEVGDFICVLKTHADIIDDFSEKTIKGLQEISRRKHFLLFEDRKLGDIGNTVQSQYTRGTHAIATWAHLTNAHLFSGPAIIPTLSSAAQQTLLSLNQSVATTISTGISHTNHDNPSKDTPTDSTSTSKPTENSSTSSSEAPPLFEHTRRSGPPHASLAATTTISQTYESASPHHPPSLIKSLSIGEISSSSDRASALQSLGPPPHARGLLLLAEMSSEGNLMGKEYTNACVRAARENKDAGFVVGYVSQRTLNTDPGDTFLSFAPGVGLPQEGEDADGVKGDGKGQQWRSPKEVVGKSGIDVVIVGRGILGTSDRAKEAERYRRAAWEAYEGRVGR